MRIIFKFGLFLIPIFVIAAIIFLVLFFNIGVSYFPFNFSKSKIIKHVQDVYGDEYELKEKETIEDEAGKIYKYVFAREDGFEFPIYSQRRHPVDSTLFGEMPWYATYIDDNYMLYLVNFYEDEIDDLLEKYNLDSDKRFSFEAGKQYLSHLKLYLNGVDEFTNAGKFISSLNKLLGADYGDSNLDNISYSSFGLDVYIKPNNLDTSTKLESDSGHIFYSYSYSPLAEFEYDASKIALRIERNFVNGVKNKKLTEYKISDELWSKYPAEYVGVTSINNSVPVDYKYNFSYDSKSKSYSMCGLYVGLNKSYNYESQGNFAYMISLLGGTYKSNSSEASWSIGNNNWSSRFFGRSNNYKYITIYKNNNIILDEYSIDKDGWGCYSVSALEDILNVNVLIDQKEIKATINSK